MHPAAFASRPNALEVIREHTRRDLMAFTRYTMPDFEVGWWNRLLAHKLTTFSRDVALKLSPKLMVFAPPRHGKSELVSIRFPVWHLGRNPRHDFICGSYSHKLAEEHSRDARQLAREARTQWVFPELVPASKRGKRPGEYRRHDLDKLEHWKVGDPQGVPPGGGSYKAVGVGGSLSGFGCNILGVDDPIKGAEQAHSEVSRDKAWDWYRYDARTRVAPGGGQLFTLTRWHDDDPAGRLQDQEGDQWDVFCHPAIALHDEFGPAGELLRRSGEALHPERWPLDALLEIKQTVGPRAFASLYQQDPVPDEGNTFEASWVRYYNRQPRRLLAEMPFDRVMAYVDPTFRKTKAGSFFCIQVWARTLEPLGFYLLGQVRVRCSYVEAKAHARRVAREWPIQGMGVEARAAGDPMYDDLVRDVPGIFPIEPKNIANRKEVEAQAVAPLWAAGQVWLPDPTMEGCDWVVDFVREVLRFPAVKYNDQVDTMSEALQDLRPGDEGFVGDALADIWG